METFAIGMSKLKNKIFLAKKALCQQYLFGKNWTFFYIHILIVFFMKFAGLRILNVAPL